jgi:hypothetical protein
MIIQRSKYVTILSVIHSGEVTTRDVNNIEAVNLEHAAMPYLICIGYGRVGLLTQRKET